jgi:5-deoxy-glucuronate isomerase
VTAPGPYHRPAGSLAAPPWTLALAPEDAGWTYAGLRVASLEPGQAVTLTTGSDEVVVLPLSGTFEVTCDRDAVSLEGRPSVFAGPTDLAYVPPGVELTITSRLGGRLAVPSARAEAHFPFRRIAAANVPIESRGAGPTAREVRRFALPGVLDADRLIASETLTPAGNWSSYPPHKHDQASADETELEEIYYYIVADGPSGAGVGYQRVYRSPAFAVDLLAEIRSGDVVLVPGGWHGPSMAAPGYDLYYLNVMAGPERAWRVTLDPAHAWVAEAPGPSGPSGAAHG